MRPRAHAPTRPRAHAPLRPCASAPLRLCDAQWALLDLNQGPSDYESGALTTELRARPMIPCSETITKRGGIPPGGHEQRTEFLDVRPFTSREP